MRALASVDALITAGKFVAHALDRLAWIPRKCFARGTLRFLNSKCKLFLKV